MYLTRAEGPLDYMENVISDVHRQGFAVKEGGCLVAGKRCGEPLRLSQLLSVFSLDNVTNTVYKDRVYLY